MTTKASDDDGPVTFGELVRIVRRIDDRTAGMAESLPDIETRLTVLEVIHPNHAHRGNGSNGSFARWLAALGTVVFSAIAGVGAAIANINSHGGPK